MAEQLPEGWGVLEVAEQNARAALDAWDGDTKALHLATRSGALAESMRALLAELDAERRFRAAGR